MTTTTITVNGQQRQDVVPTGAVLSNHRNRPRTLLHTVRRGFLLTSPRR
jgi:hypothetical protein